MNWSALDWGILGPALIAGLLVLATHVPLAANAPSPGNAGGMLLLMSSQFTPSVVRRLGKTPSTESLCEMPRFGVQNAKQS